MDNKNKILYSCFVLPIIAIRACLVPSNLACRRWQFCGSDFVCTKENAQPLVYVCRLCSFDQVVEPYRESMILESRVMDCCDIESINEQEKKFQILNATHN